jgi:hypothetical protein
VRIELNAVLSTNRDWQDFTVRINLRPNLWVFHSVASEKMLHFKMEDGAGSYEQVFPFSELQNPQTLLREFAGPVPLALLTEAGLPLETDSENDSPASLGLTWDARESWLRVGHSSIPVYRLQTRLLDRYPVVIILSRVGEILRVDLPGDVRFLNEQLSGS